MRCKGLKNQEIGARLNRSESTIREAFKRCTPARGSRDMRVWERAKDGWEKSERLRHSSRKKLRLKNQTIRVYVEEKFKLGWSPELIAGRLPIDHPGESISYEAIYEYIEQEAPELKKYLHRAGKSRRGKPGARGRAEDKFTANGVAEISHSRRSI